MFAGIIATAAMTLFTYMAPLMGFEMNIPKMLAGSMGAHIIVGWLAHFMIGVILAFNYATVFLSFTKREPGIKTGALFVILPRMLTQIMVMPLMSVIAGGSYSEGLFSGSFVIAMASLVGHLIYGTVLGWPYKPQTFSKVVNA